MLSTSFLFGFESSPLPFQNAVVYDLEKIIFKLVGCFCSQSRIQINISYEPCTLLEPDNSVHFTKHQSTIQCFRAQMCTTYFFLLLRFGTGLSTFLIFFILSTMKNKLLCMLCSSWCYSTYSACLLLILFENHSNNSCKKSNFMDCIQRLISWLVLDCHVISVFTIHYHEYLGLLPYTFH